MEKTPGGSDNGVTAALWGCKLICSLCSGPGRDGGERAGEALGLPSASILPSGLPQQGLALGPICVMSCAQASAHLMLVTGCCNPPTATQQPQSRFGAVTPVCAWGAGR